MLVLLALVCTAVVNIHALDNGLAKTPPSKYMFYISIILNLFEAYLIEPISTCLLYTSPSPRDS